MHALRIDGAGELRSPGGLAIRPQVGNLPHNKRGSSHSFMSAASDDLEFGAEGASITRLHARGCIRHGCPRPATAGRASEGNGCVRVVDVGLAFADIVHHDGDVEEGRSRGACWDEEQFSDFAAPASLPNRAAGPAYAGVS